MKSRRKQKQQTRRASREVIKAISDLIWGKLTSINVKEKTHVQSIYSFLTEWKLDSFGMAYAVVAACQLLGYAEVFLALSEDHAWVEFSGGEEQETAVTMETAEVTWHGRGQEDKRGLPVTSGVAERSWIYLNGHAVVCRPRVLGVAAAITAINPGVTISTQSQLMTQLKHRLLWLLYDSSLLDRYPLALTNLADLEELWPTPARPSALHLYEEAIRVARTFYSDQHVCPYLSRAGHHYRRMEYAAAIKYWASAARVIANYNYTSEDEEIYKEFLEIAHHFLPQIMRRVTESTGHSGSAINTTTEPQPDRATDVSIAVDDVDSDVNIVGSVDNRLHGAYCESSVSVDSTVNRSDSPRRQSTDDVDGVCSAVDRVDSPQNQPISDVETYKDSVKNVINTDSRQRQSVDNVESVKTAVNRVDPPDDVESVKTAVNRVDTPCDVDCAVNSGLVRDPQCLAHILRFFDGMCLWEEGSSTPVLHVGWANKLMATLVKFDTESREGLILEAASGMDHPVDEEEEEATDGRHKSPGSKWCTSDGVELCPHACSPLVVEGLRRREPSVGSSVSPFVFEDDVHGEEISPGPRLLQPQPQPLPPPAPIDLSILVKDLGRRLLNPDYLMGLPVEPFLPAGTDVTPPISALVESRMTTPPGPATTAEPAPEDHVTPADPATPAEPTPEDHVTPPALTTSAEPPPEDHMTPPSLTTTRLVLRSAKMCGIRDLLTARRLNSSAIKLQLTAQSQVRLKRTDLHSAYLLPRKRARRC